MQPDSRIFVAGHRGLVGSAIVRELERRRHRSIITRSRSELDLADRSAVDSFFARERPEFVFLAAAKVGGILANNTYPADFIRDNLDIQSNVIEASRRADVKRLLFLGSSCIYPKLCPQPIKEEYLLTGPLEPTNRPYAIAKIAGIEMSWSYNRQYGTQYLAAMPTNLYGPNDDLDLNNSHETPAEEFRTLRTRLNHMQTLQPLHTIVVTSPSPAEGKTFSAVNLALAQAHLAENPVLLTRHGDDRRTRS